MTHHDHHHHDHHWNARRILKELCEPDRRKQILMTFWKKGDDMSRRIATAQLAKLLRFREETLRKSPLDKKAQYLGSRLGAPELEEVFEAALMTYHLQDASELMGAFLDQWHIPHENGSIEADDYEPPDRAKVDEAVAALGERFSQQDILVYLASAGLIMGEGMDAWRESTWSYVDEHMPTERSV